MFAATRHTPATNRRVVLFLSREEAHRLAGECASADDAMDLPLLGELDLVLTNTLHVDPKPGDCVQFRHRTARQAHWTPETDGYWLTYLGTLDVDDRTVYVVRGDAYGTLTYYDPATWQIRKDQR